MREGHDDDVTGASAARPRPGAPEELTRAPAPGAPGEPAPEAAAEGVGRPPFAVETEAPSGTELPAGAEAPERPGPSEGAESGVPPVAPPGTALAVPEVRHFAGELATQLFQRWQLALREQFDSELRYRLNAELQHREHAARTVHSELRERRTYYDNSWRARHGAYGYATFEMDQTIRRQRSELDEMARQTEEIRSRLHELGRNRGESVVTVGSEGGDRPEAAAAAEAGAWDRGPETGPATPEEVRPSGGDEGGAPPAPAQTVEEPVPGARTGGETARAAREPARAEHASEEHASGVRASGAPEGGGPEAAEAERAESGAEGSAPGGALVVSPEEAHDLAVALSAELFEPWERSLRERFEEELGQRLEDELVDREREMSFLRDEVEERLEIRDGMWTERHPRGLATDTQRWELEQTIRRQAHELADGERVMRELRERLRDLGHQGDGVIVDAEPGGGETGG